MSTSAGGAAASQAKRWERCGRSNQRSGPLNPNATSESNSPDNAPVTPCGGVARLTTPWAGRTNLRTKPQQSIHEGLAPDKPNGSRMLHWHAAEHPCPLCHCIFAPIKKVKTLAAWRLLLATQIATFYPARWRRAACYTLREPRSCKPEHIHRNGEHEP